MSKNHVITTFGLLSTSMTIAACTDKNEPITHESIAGEWVATSMSYEGENLSLPSEECMSNGEGTYCYVMSIGMIIDEEQSAMITLSYFATLDDVIIDDESMSTSSPSSVILKEESNSYGIILDNEDEFFGNLNCTLASDVLSCTVADDEGHQISFAR
ncbi:MAG: hypothetical protein CL916_11165 [Deltaproteobacteria bacterium]|nr:hypothetical protein [Deltaproteobacteria bacterium]